jgi:hypothetical protein
MTVGIPPNLGLLNIQAGTLLVNLRNAVQQAQAFGDYISLQGEAGLMAMGMAQADAAELLDVYANLQALAGAFYGLPYTGPALPFNFYHQIVPLTGGQT